MDEKQERYEEISYGCLNHSGFESRIKALERTMEKMEERFERVNNKMNLLLGAVTLLWPAIQIFMWFWGQGKR